MLRRSLIIVGAVMLSGCTPVFATHNAALRVQCQSGDQPACVSYEAAVKACQSQLSPWAASWTKQNCAG
jgi:hypothetical protein